MKQKITLSLLLFFVSLVFLAAYLFEFNNQIRFQEDICFKELTKKNPVTCKLNGYIHHSIRLTARQGGFPHSNSSKIKIDVSIEENASQSYLPKPASTDGGGRNKLTLNYGIIQLPKQETVLLQLSTSTALENLQFFEIKLKSNPNNFYIYLHCAFFLVFLFLTIYYRKSVFKGKYTSFLPYTLFLLVVLLVATWDL
ncbi:hypothetical protein ACFOEK_10590 [Litoribrevibacter euphylliae]|uniref:Uncharacterized protein n=1 Tax=Litoribrevibacter euphylliae TaxID=1834034 RepID=A0ABV7HC29_9GAMM